MAKPDYAHKLTDEQLAKLERRIANLYKEAADELTDTVKAYFEQFEKRDAAMKEKLDAGEITDQQYKQWRLAQMGRGKRYEALRDKVANRYTNANETAVAYVNDATPGIYSLNRNYAAYKIEQVSSQADFTLWDEQTVKRLIVEQPDLMPYYPPKRALQRGIDLKYGKQQITASVTSSILQGKSIPKIANDLQSRMQDMSRASAIRTARTAITEAQNAGRLDIYRAARDMGIKLKKQWLATLDNRTRHAHAMLDGQTVDVDKPFKVDGYEIMYPGDSSAPGYLVYNCRCTQVSVLDDVDTSGGMRWARDPETGESVLVKDMTYAEWAGWKKETTINGKDLRIQNALRTQAASVADGIALAESKGVKYARFDKMNLEQVNNILNAVDTLPQDCRPAMIANGKDISTATGRPLGRKADQWWGVTYDYRQFGIRTMQLGYDKTDYDGGILVGLNTQKFKNIDDITKAKEKNNEKYRAKTGNDWSFNTDGRATAYHEFGHCVVDVRGLPDNWKSISSAWAEESKCDILKTPDEAFAEAWAAYHLGDERLPQNIAEIIQKIAEGK